MKNILFEGFKNYYKKLEEEVDGSINLYTYQSPSALQTLKSGKTYYASFDKSALDENTYKELARILNINHCPIFCGLTKEDTTRMMESSGLSVRDRDLIVLEVPINEIHKMAYYDWTDYIYFWILKQEDDTITKEEAENLLRNYSGDTPCQVVIDRIEPEWLIENDSSKRPTTNESIKLNNVSRKSLSESKQDIEKFRQWAGEDLANRFFKIKDRLQGKEKDIYYWMKQSKQELAMTLRELEQIPTKKERDILAKEGSEKIYEDDNWLVLWIDTYEASTRYGKGTSWCISGDRDDSGKEDFEAYKGYSGEIYFYIDKKHKENNYNDKYALIYTSANDWILWASGDVELVGKGESFTNALEWDNEWSVEELMDWFPTPPKFPKVKGLPDINRRWNYIITHKDEFDT